MQLAEWESHYFPTQAISNRNFPWRAPPSFLIEILVQLLGDEFPAQVCVFWAAHARHLRLTFESLMGGDSVWASGEFKHAKSLELHGCQQWIDRIYFQGDPRTNQNVWFSSYRAVTSLASPFLNLESLNLEYWSPRLPLSLFDLPRYLPKLQRLHVGMKQFTITSTGRANVPSIAVVQANIMDSFFSLPRQWHLRQLKTTSRDGFYPAVRGIIRPTIGVLPLARPLHM